MHILVFGGPSPILQGAVLVRHQTATMLLGRVRQSAATGKKSAIYDFHAS